MKSSVLGKSISKAEVLDISPFGVWLHVHGKEYFLAYQDYPWFKNSKVSDIYNLKLLNNSHLYWPNLDIDLEVSSLVNPEKYPLIYK
ncbi:MAG: DUF2442 domain-containing protein [Elusimicrobiota bacterium]